MAQTSTPIDTTLPGAYQGQQIDAEAAYQTALQNIAMQQAQAMQSYGFTGDIDQSTGALTNEHIDPNDQYSQVMGLLNSHAANMQALRNGLMGRGLGATGLSAQQQALLKFTQAGETSNLGNQFTQTLNGLYGQQQNALATRNQAFTSAEQQALMYQIQQQLFDTAPTPGAATTKSTNGAAKPATATGTLGNVVKTTNVPNQGSVSGGAMGTGLSNALTLAKNFGQPVMPQAPSNAPSGNVNANGQGARNSY